MVYPDYLARSLDSQASTFLFAWLEDPQKYPYEKQAIERQKALKTASWLLMR